MKCLKTVETVEQFAQLNWNNEFEIDENEKNGNENENEIETIETMKTVVCYFFSEKINLVTPGYLCKANNIVLKD